MVNSEPLARVWSPLLAIVLLVLLFPTLYLKAALIYRGALLLGVALSRSDSWTRLNGALSWESKIESADWRRWSGTLSNQSAAP